MINFVTGNLGRKGGTHKPDGLLNHYPPAGGTQHIETSMGAIEVSEPMGYVTLPATLLPDLIEHGDIRALIVIAGNPLLSAGGEEIGRASCREKCVSKCRSRWAPEHK